MAKFESYQQGTPSWIEYSSADQQASKDFYAELFGWDYDVNPMNDEQGNEVGSYATAKVQGDDVAGLGPVMSPDQSASWGVYLAADDVDAVVKKAQDAGGQVLAGPMDIGDMGRMAWVLDPGGAAVGLWQAGSFAGCQRTNEPGTNRWNELTVADPPATAAFYADILDIGVDQQDMGPDAPAYTSLSVDGRTVAGTMPLQPGMQPHWTVYFNVDDVDATVARAKELGATEFAPAFDVPGVGRLGYLIDPQGATFNLFQNPPSGG